METVVGYMVGRVGDTECMDELERGVAVSQNLYMVELIGEVLGAREVPRQCSAFAGWGGPCDMSFIAEGVAACSHMIVL
jgi:hypothetical protein